MISILYGERDFEAASIALKVQSLSQNQPTRIYIVPKHYGRNVEEIHKNLLQTQAAVFLAYDLHSVDEITKQELAVLKSNNIPIKYVVPNEFDVSQLHSSATENTIYHYSAHSTNNAAIVNNLSNTINDLKNIINKPKLIKMKTRNLLLLDW